MTGAIVLALAVDGAAAVEYEVSCARRCAELRVEAAVPAAMGNRFVVESGFGPYLKDTQYEDGGRWVEAEVRGDEVVAPRCRSRACRVRYRMRLAEAARQTRDRGAFAQEGMIIAPPSAWLLRPQRVEAGGRFRLRVAPPGDARFATGLFTGDSDGVYEGRLDHLDEAPHSAFGLFSAQTLRVGKQVVEVAIAPGLEARRRDLTTWVDAAARDVAAYYGKYPVPRALVLILEGRRGVTRGKTLGHGGASVAIWVSPTTTPAVLAADWLLVHEMVRFGLPNLPREHRWLEEGFATYAEPLARAARGRLTASEVWMGLLDGLPKGVPRKQDRGLDDSRTWASTYWGGALFSFLADLAIRERTDNRRSLRDALRGVQAAGGTIAVSWPLERTLAAGDAATGVPVLRELHAKMGPKRVDVNLDDVWRRLGVSRKGTAVAFDDKAPLARIRRSMTEGVKGAR